ncbi:MAG: serine/threonine protein kinase [Acidobacteria bacterium]|nr:serine/threonine protein kinase [Acidobacteriota bacterium]
MYRARDTTLHRDVAIKVLPDDVASDPERLTRFQREAQALAALNHPNIATIYGVEESAAGGRALVMELVDGPTLADRLTQGAIPLTEALHIARQIADALEAAHDKGIVHCDLMPANIKFTAPGAARSGEPPLPGAEDRHLERRLSAADVADV